MEREISSSEDDKKRKYRRKEDMEKLINEWLKEFKITQPSDFFFDNPITSEDLFGHIIDKTNFFLDTLTYFGLPEGYIDGKGQWMNYSKMKKDEMKKKKRTDELLSKNTGKRKGHTDDDIPPPEYFDFVPLNEAFKNFVDSSAEIRTKVRLQIEEEEKKIMLLFCHENGELKEERCQDILSIAEHLSLDLQPNQIEGFGWVLE